MFMPPLPRCSHAIFITPHPLFLPFQFSHLGTVKDHSLVANGCDTLSRHGNHKAMDGWTPI